MLQCDNTCTSHIGIDKTVSNKLQTRGAVAQNALLLVFHGTLHFSRDLTKRSKCIFIVLR